MGLPTSGKPTASQVVNWAISQIGKRVDLPGSGYGAQCWDLPNYIFNRYWGFRTPGNARDMVGYRYPSGFKIIKKTADFIPIPGDIPVWTKGNYNWNTWGHTAIIVGPVTTSYFYSVDQNWYNSNSFRGSPGARVKHSYVGVTHFIRPAYKKEEKPKTDVKPKPSNKLKQPIVNSTTSKPAEDTKPISKIVTRIKYTVVSKDSEESKEIFDTVVLGKERLISPKKILIKNAISMDSVRTLYQDRNLIFKEGDYPHYFIDRYHIWSPRSIIYKVPGHNDTIVIVVCEDLNTSDDTFKRNELAAMTLIKKLCHKYNILFESRNIHIDKKAWRTLSIHQSTSQELMKLYENKNKILNEVPKDIIEKIRIKTFVKVNKQDLNSTSIVKSTNGNKTPSYITKERSNYTFEDAINIQMRHTPKISNGITWINASKQQVKNAMNTSNIFNSTTQIYQFLKLDKYQGVAVEKLNEILKGKGTLNGKGQAFADACKKYELNEIYLIAHAILESGSGTSNFASGNSGYYNYFGIGAFDSNPNNAINFAKKKGWTTPEKAIIGGAEFVRKDYIAQRQNTLYRMRWNPKKPGTHQYATDIRWASHQATTIANYYKKIDLKGKYFIYDQYK